MEHQSRCYSLIGCGLAAVLLAGGAHGMDLSKLATNTESFDSWTVVQFALPTSLHFRLATESPNDPKSTLTIDFQESCLPTQS